MLGSPFKFHSTRQPEVYNLRNFNVAAGPAAPRCVALTLVHGRYM